MSSFLIYIPGFIYFFWIELKVKWKQPWFWKYWNYKQQKKPNKLLIFRTNCSFFNLHLNWQLWNIQIKETAVYKNLLSKHICLRLILPVWGSSRSCDLISHQLFPLRQMSSLLLKTSFTEMTGINEKKCFVCSLSNQKLEWYIHYTG